MTTTLDAGRAPAPAEARPGSAASRVLAALPTALPAALAALGAVAMLFLLLGQFRPLLVIPLGGLAAAAAAAVVLREQFRLDASADGQLRPDLAALLFVAGWTLVNLREASQNIVVFRDPATYALTGQYLTEHPSLPMDAGRAVFGGVPGATFETNGFAALPEPGLVQPQGSHMLQTLLAIGGWVAGDAALLRVSVLLGAVGLLAVYAFTRQVAVLGIGSALAGRPRRAAAGWLALGATAVLSITLPMLEFSRASYTEPLALACTFGGFALVWAAHRSDSTPLFVVAGVVVGALAMTRIDGLFNLLAVIPYATGVLVLAAGRPDARRRRLQLVAFLVPVVLLTALAVRDLQALAPLYYADLGNEVGLIRTAALGLLVLGAGVVLVVRLRPGWTRPLVAASGRIGVVAGVLLVLGMAVLASRPLWYVDHSNLGGGYSEYIEFLQRAKKQTVDGTRAYSEQSIKWLYWYVGAPAVAVGVLGLGMLVARTVRRLEPELVLPVSMWLATAGLYLNKVSITPDQIWGSRRLLPLVFPMVLVGAVVAVGRLLRWRPVGVVVAVGFGGLVAWNTISASDDLWRVRQGTPQLAEVRALCAALPPDAAVVTVGSLTGSYLQTVRSYCDVPGVGVRDTGAGELGRLAVAARDAGRTLYVVAPKRAPLGVPETAPAFSSIRAPHWNATLTTRPSADGYDERSLFVGVVAVDGRVTLLPPGGPTLPT